MVVDVREPEEFAAGHVTGAKNVPLGQLETLARRCQEQVVAAALVCATGARAQRAVAMPKKLGYETGPAVAGGLKAWKDANLPVEKA